MRRTRAMVAGVVVGATVAVAGCSPHVAAPESREASDVVVSVAEDEYEGYFDAEASPVSDDEAVGAMWGSFGTGRGIGPVGWSHGSAAPGTYVVTVECAGPDEIEVRFDQTDHRQDATTRLTCPGSVSFDATTTETGFMIELDSAGAPGAYRISVAPRIAS
ncbi:hypothetical protein ACYX8G_10825 [Microbacterium saperdae]